MYHKANRSRPTHATSLTVRHQRRLVAASTGLLLVGLLVAPPFSFGSATAASTYPPIPPGPILIGAGATLSGPAASYGKSEVALMDLGLDLFKADYPKGIDGHQIKAVTADDGGTAPGGVGVANEFVSDHVAAAFYLSDDSTINGLQADVLKRRTFRTLKISGRISS